MAINLEINDELLEEAVIIGNFQTKKDAVNKALEDFAQNKKQLKMLELQNTIEYFEDYDCKEGRFGRVARSERKA